MVNVERKNPPKHEKKTRILTVFSCNASGSSNIGIRTAETRFKLEKKISKKKEGFSYLNQYNSNQKVSNPRLPNLHSLRLIRLLIFPEIWRLSH